MSSPSLLPGDIKRNKFTKALKRLGFVINTRGGDGSHIKAEWLNNNKSVTIPKDIPKETLRYLL